MSKEGKHEEPSGTPPGRFISDELRAETARFLEELRKRLRRQQTDEPKLKPPYNG